MSNVVTKKRLEYLEELRMLDDKYAKIVFKDVNCTLEVLNTLMNEVVVIEHHETEAYLQVIGGRSIRCDILVIKGDKSVIDMELQNQKGDMHKKRIRYHTSVLDTSVSKPQQDFSDMCDIVVIFICDFDPEGKGYPLYHVKRIVEETNEDFEDGIRIMLVNGTYQGDDEIGRLVHDLRCTHPDDMYNEVLREANKYYKETKEGQRIMCDAWEEERREGKLASLKSLMETMSLTLEEAMNALKFTEEEKQICRERLR